MADPEVVAWCEKVMQALKVLEARVEVQSTRLEVLEKEAKTYDHKHDHEDGK